MKNINVIYRKIKAWFPQLHTYHDHFVLKSSKSGNHNKGTKDDDIEETGEPAERLLDPIFKVGVNNKPQCSFKLEVKFVVLIGSK